MEAQPLADLLQALADPTRLRILALLRRMELSVGELAIILDQSQPRVSRHVRILADAGIVERRREGSWVFLTIAPEERTEPMFHLVDAWADAPSEEAFRLARTATTPQHWKAFEKRYRAEMSAPDKLRMLALLAALSHKSNFSVGCYCEDETRCHRSILRTLLEEQGATIT